MIPRSLSLIALALLCACTREITDTEGRTFSFECTGTNCTLQAIKPPPQSPPDAPLQIQSSGRILAVCASTADARTCRPVTCDSASPCAQLGGAHFACDSGLCQAPESPLTDSDRVALCLSGTGPTYGAIPQRERLALALGCHPPCNVPAACRQP